MQETINKELTSRMEEDKAREAAATGITKSKVVDEAKEEDNYGEEVVEEEV
jgi:Cu2+-containing amine oxidase